MLSNGNHQLRVEATDGSLAKSVRIWDFQKLETTITFNFFETPELTDVAAKKILITPTWNIEGAISVKVEACNNAFDAAPTWEDITAMVNINRLYNFTNTTKTATDWGVNVRLTVEKNALFSGEVSVFGLGGAYE